MEIIRGAGHQTELIDLADEELPAFDNGSVFQRVGFARLHERIRVADGIVRAFPIYNWAPGSTAKSLIESTGATGDGINTSAWFDQVVTFICSAGLPHSYMATGTLAQSLMTDFKCVINPYIAYISDRDWEGDALAPDRHTRLEKTLTVHAELVTLLSARSYASTWEV